MSDDETISLILGLLTLCCCCGGLLVATGTGLFFFLRRRKTSVGAGGPAPMGASPHTDPAPPDAVRQALLALNRTQPPKPYTVRLDGEKVVCEWASADAAGLNTNSKLEIMLDEATHIAYFLEIESGDAESVKNDARQAIRSAGWNIQS